MNAKKMSVCWKARRPNQMACAAALFLAALALGCQKIPTEPDALANYHYAKGNYAESMRAADEALALDASNWRMHVLRGRSHAQLREWDGAIEEFTRAIELAPSEPEPLYQRSMIYNILGESELALADTLASADRHANYEISKQYLPKQAPIDLDLSRPNPRGALEGSGGENGPSRSGEQEANADEDNPYDPYALTRRRQQEARDAERRRNLPAFEIDRSPAPRGAPATVTSQLPGGQSTVLDPQHAPTAGDLLTAPRGESSVDDAYQRWLSDYRKGRIVRGAPGEISLGEAGGGLSGGTGLLAPSAPPDRNAGDAPQTNPAPEPPPRPPIMTGFPLPGYAPGAAGGFPAGGAPGGALPNYLPPTPATRGTGIQSGLPAAGPAAAPQGPFIPGVNGLPSSGLGEQRFYPVTPLNPPATGAAPTTPPGSASPAPYGPSTSPSAGLGPQSPATNRFGGPGAAGGATPPYGTGVPTRPGIGTGVVPSFRP